MLSARLRAASENHSAVVGALTGLLLLAGMLYSCLALIRLFEELGKRGVVEQRWEVAVILASIAFGMLVLGVVEILSLVKLLTRGGLAAAWAGIALGLWFALKRLSPALEPASGFWKRIRQIELERPWLGWSQEVKFLAGFTVLLVLVLGGIALWTAPTSWDSLTYHLPRVMHWLQNSSIAHFPTSDTRQLEAGPWAGFAVLHFYSITDNDRLVNLVQWAAMALTLAGVSWIAGELSRTGNDHAAKQRVRAWAAFLCATLPTGIVQAITPLTDYIVAWWFVATVCSGMLLMRQPANLIYAAAFGASLALGLLTKATMAMAACVAVPLLGLLALKKASSLRSQTKLIAVFTMVCALLVAPHFSRNNRVFGAPLGSEYMYSLSRNAKRSPAVTLSNFLRNLSLHAATGIEPVTEALNKAIQVAHSLTGMDLNDRGTTYFTSTFAFQKGLPISDNSTGNFWHLLLVMLGALYLGVKSRNYRRDLLLIFGTVLVTLVVFCTYLRWNEWNARFHLPLVISLLPVPAVALGLYWPALAKAATGIAAGLLALICTFYNQSRPLLTGHDFPLQPREQQYFHYAPYLFEPTIEVSKDIIASGVTNVGMRFFRNFYEFQDDAEYPLWVLLKNHGFEGKIYNAFVTNRTAALQRLPDPDVLVSSMKGTDELVAPVFRHKNFHPPYKLYWSEQSSRWAMLSFVSSDGGEQPLPRQGVTFPFSNYGCVLSCRVPRQGVLTLRGVFLADGRPVTWPSAMGLQSYAGFSVVKHSTNGAHLLDVALPPGQTALKLGAQVARATNIAFADLQWEWFPTDEPLPYAFISRITEVETQPASGNPYFFRRGQSRKLELISGGSGSLDILVEPALSSGHLLSISNTVVLTNIVLSAGMNQVRVPVQRGTNTFQLTFSRENLQEVLEFKSIDLRFRDLTE